MTRHFVIPMSGETADSGVCHPEAEEESLVHWSTGPLTTNCWSSSDHTSDCEGDISRLDICQALLTFLDELKNILKFPHCYKYLHIYTNSHIYTLKCDPKMNSVKRLEMQISFLTNVGVSHNEKFLQNGLLTPSCWARYIFEDKSFNQHWPLTPRLGKIHNLL